jgi:hypothetical protein
MHIMSKKYKFQQTKEWNKIFEIKTA